MSSPTLLPWAVKAKFNAWFAINYSRSILSGCFFKTSIVSTEFDKTSTLKSETFI